MVVRCSISHWRAICRQVTGFTVGLNRLAHRFDFLDDIGLGRTGFVNPVPALIPSPGAGRLAFTRAALANPPAWRRRIGMDENQQRTDRLAGRFS
jgi:hypothetical protein